MCANGHPLQPLNRCGESMASQVTWHIDKLRMVHATKNAVRVSFE